MLYCAKPCKPLHLRIAHFGEPITTASSEDLIKNAPEKGAFQIYFLIHGSVQDFIVLAVAAIQDFIVLFKTMLSRNNQPNLPARLAFRSGGYLVDRQVRAVEFLFRLQPDAGELLHRAIYRIAARERNRYPEQRAAQLRHEAHAADAAERLEAEDAGSDAAPRAAQAMQRPHAEHIVDLPAVLRQRKHPHKQTAGHAA